MNKKRFLVGVILFFVSYTSLDASFEKETSTKITGKKRRFIPLEDLSKESTKDKPLAINPSSSSSSSSLVNGQGIPSYVQAIESSYNPQKTRNMYNQKLKSSIKNKKQRAKSSQILDESNDEPDFVVSRSKIGSYLQCQQCFWMECKYGLRPEPGLPFTLNNAVDALVKKDMDDCRKEKKAHPLFKQAQLEDKVPFDDERMSTWQDSLHHGLRHKIPGTNIVLQGGIDDAVIDQKTGLVSVVDAKATSMKAERFAEYQLNEPHHAGYKQQLDIYAYLFEQNGIPHADQAFIMYFNAKKDIESFNNQLAFDSKLFAHRVNTQWVPGIIYKIYELLKSNDLPPSGEHCDSCKHFKAKSTLLATLKNEQDDEQDSDGK
ncbi:MAG: PD-(D/E)XK nuclease family protein [Candidatus Chromulinivorax sp.]